MKKIGIIGAGAWGTALAQNMANAGRDVILWAREPEVVQSVNSSHENELFLKGVKLHPAIKATESVSQAADSDVIMLVTPAQHVRASLGSLKGHLADGRPVIICAKGIELDTGLLMSQVATDVVPNAVVAIMTGPTFASEIARGLPCAVTLAIQDKDVAQELADTIGNKALRPYISDDLLGTQIGGAVKNVIAIACGVIAGRKMGESARAALVTRGLAEMARLASAMGANKQTLTGMCGIGDLMLTCASMQSRNYSLGMALGEGKSLQDILSSRNSVTEGVHTAKALMVMAKKHAVEMPISEAVHKCLNEGVAIDDVIEDILGRPIKKETT